MHLETVRVINSILFFLCNVQSFGSFIVFPTYFFLFSEFTSSIASLYGMQIQSVLIFSISIMLLLAALGSDGILFKHTFFNCSCWVIQLNSSSVCSKIIYTCIGPLRRSRMLPAVICEVSLVVFSLLKSHIASFHSIAPVSECVLVTDRFPHMFIAPLLLFVFLRTPSSSTPLVSANKHEWCGVNFTICDFIKIIKIKIVK